MTCFRLRFAAALVLALAGNARGDVVYNVSSYPSPAGWTIGGGPGWSFDGGTITTIDGFTGDLNAANIPTALTSWSFTFTSPRGTTTLDASNSTFAYWNDNAAQNLKVAGGEIYFPVATSGRDHVRIFSNALVVGGPYSGDPQTEISFYSKYNSSNPHFLLVDRLTPTLVAAEAASSTGLHLVAAAAVPEASSFAMTGLALAAVGLSYVAARAATRARSTSIDGK